MHENLFNVHGGAHGRVYAVTTEFDEWLSSRSRHDLNSAEEYAAPEHDVPDDIDEAKGESAKPPYDYTAVGPTSSGRLSPKAWVLGAACLLLAIIVWSLSRLRN